MREKLMENRFQKAREEQERMKDTVENCPFRMKYHIMPPVGWINDPNGLCQFRGVFHAYFQYSPLSVHGGGGYWGHCTSRDLFHWEYHEPVLTTDIPEDASGVYSGSALIEDDRLYLFYTGNVKLPGDYDYIDAGRISTQLLVESEDGFRMSGKTKLLGMEDYPQDITAHVRDPKVWKEGNGYRMVLGARARKQDENGCRRDQGCALLYASADRKHWTLSGRIEPEESFGFMWECPDFFELDGRTLLSFCPQGLEAEEERFQNIYQSGYSFLDEGKAPEAVFREWDMGFDFYAPQTFLTEDGRRVLIGWCGVPDTEKTHRNLSVENGWQHCLTLPTELAVKNGRVLRMPVREIRKLPWRQPEQMLSFGEAQAYEFGGRQMVRVQIRSIKGQRQEILIGSRENGLWICAEGDLVTLSFLNGSGEPAACGGGRTRRIGRTENRTEELLIFIDSSIAEVFVNQGELVFTTRFYLENRKRKLQIRGAGQTEIAVC